MKTIPLTQGKVALVSDEDFEWLSQRKWHALQVKHKGVRSTWYAATDNGGRKLSMHRAIGMLTGHSKSSQFDHKDGDGLNNQRDNVRPCSQSQNNGNRIKEAGCVSRFKGVSWSKSRKKWVSRLRLNGKSYGVKRFADEESAARHYDTHARLQFGEFARLNFP